MSVKTLVKLVFSSGMIGMNTPSPSNTSSSALGGYPPPQARPEVPVPDDIPAAALSPGRGDVYTFYKGDGSAAAGWPGVDQWVDFYTMWEINEPMMNKSCAIFGDGIPNDSADEVNDILNAVAEQAENTGVDKRFILAVIMQESKGCVRVKSTTSPGAAIHNPGLMQTHNGKGTCNANGTPDTPCSAESISQMIKDGTAGTADGDGLQQTLKQSEGTGAPKYYRAARMYNSGAVDPSGDLGAGCCTHCYASDVANRLTGWVGADSACTLDSAAAPSWSAEAPSWSAAAAPVWSADAPTWTPAATTW